MKVPPDHYKGPQATSKGHTPLLIPVAAMGKCKQAMNFKRAIMVTQPHYWNKMGHRAHEHTCMRMIPTVYGPPEHNMDIYEVIIFCVHACSVKKVVILSGIHIHTLQKQLWIAWVCQYISEPRVHAWWHHKFLHASYNYISSMLLLCRSCWTNMLCGNESNSTFDFNENAPIEARPQVI